jgi:hypothetical protein
VRASRANRCPSCAGVAAPLVLLDPAEVLMRSASLTGGERVTSFRNPAGGREPIEARDRKTMARSGKTRQPGSR